MPTTKESRSEIDNELTDSIRQLHDVSTRIDERIKHLIEKQSTMSDKIERAGASISEISTRLAILEQAGIYQARKEIEDLDKKLAVFDKQLNNGINTDVFEMKTSVSELLIKIRALELSNEHNTSFRNKGEARFEYWFNLFWKLIITFAAGAVLYKLGFK